MPMIAFIGVRISWLMLARKSDFRRVAVCARSMASRIALVRRPSTRMKSTMSIEVVNCSACMVQKLAGTAPPIIRLSTSEPQKLSAQPPRK